MSVKGFEYELTTKQKFYLYLYQRLPHVELIHELWNVYKIDRDKTILKYYEEISPFQSHPCGNDCLFHPVAGFIDPDIFMDYYNLRVNYLNCIQMIGHPYFFCQFKKSKEELESSKQYFTTIINEPQIKLSSIKKKRILDKAILYLYDQRYELTIDQIIRYLYSLYSMYKDIKVLYSYPIAIDVSDELCRFE